jgi:hypothetical protein
MPRGKYMRVSYMVLNTSWKCWRHKQHFLLHGDCLLAESFVVTPPCSFKRRGKIARSWVRCTGSSPDKELYWARARYVKSFIHLLVHGNPSAGNPAACTIETARMVLWGLWSNDPCPILRPYSNDDATNSAHEFITCSLPKSPDVQYIFYKW